MTAAAATPEVFGAVHLGLLGLTVVLGVAVVWAGRRLRGRAVEPRITRAAGWALLVASVLWAGWWLLPGNWDIGRSLPLHYSDVLRYVVVVALILRTRWAIAITYYWGLTLNLQALLTPHPSQLQWPSVEFPFYWGLHIAVLLAPLALIWGLGHRPRWQDFRIAFGAALIWGALIMGVNALIGTNYGFLNEHPPGASVLDLLGPWPIYVLWEIVLVGGIWALMTWPWTRRDRQRRGAPEGSSSSERPDGRPR